MSERAVIFGVVLAAIPAVLIAQESPLSPEAEKAKSGVPFLESLRAPGEKDSSIVGAFGAKVALENARTEAGAARQPGLKTGEVPAPSLEVNDPMHKLFREAGDDVGDGTYMGWLERKRLEAIARHADAEFRRRSARDSMRLHGAAIGAGVLGIALGGLPGLMVVSGAIIVLGVAYVAAKIIGSYLQYKKESR